MCFSSLEKFLNLKSDGQLNSIIASLSCVVIEAHLTTSDKIGLLVEFVHGFQMQMKHLVIHVPIIQNYTVLQDQIINYNAKLYHDGRFMQLFLMSNYFLRIHIIGGQIISLCPTLGKKYALIYDGT